MPLFRPLTDDEEIDRFEKATQKRMNKYFDKPLGSNTFPDNASVLSENDIYATAFNAINNTAGRIKIGYKTNMGFFIKDHLRVRIDVYHIGTLLCEGIISKRIIDPLKKSSIIVTGIFNKTKTIRFPIQNQSSMELVCKKIIIEDFARFSDWEEGNLIPLNEKLDLLRRNL